MLMLQSANHVRQTRKTFEIIGHTPQQSHISDKMAKVSRGNSRSRNEADDVDARIRGRIRVVPPPRSDALSRRKSMDHIPRLSKTVNNLSVLSSVQIVWEGWKFSSGRN